MNVTVDRPALAAALKHASLPAGIYARSIYGGVHLAADAKANVLTITATNGDLTVIVDVPATVANAGAPIVVPARLLAGFVGAARGATITVDAGDAITVTSGETVATLRPMLADEWPAVGSPITGAETVLDVDDLERIGRVLHAAISDAKQRITRPALAGVHLAGSTAQATDSYRHAAATLDAEVPEMLVPLDVLQRVTRAGVPVTVTVDDHRAAFATDTVTWMTSLIDSPFPPTAQFLGHKGSQTLRFSTTELADAIERVALIQPLDKDGKPTSPHVQFGRDGDKALLSSVSSDVGEIVDVVTCEGDYDGALILDYRYLSQLLAAHGEEMVTVEVEGGLKPVVARTSDGRLLQLIMPVRPSVNA